MPKKVVGYESVFFYKNRKEQLSNYFTFFRQKILHFFVILSGS